MAKILSDDDTVYRIPNSHEGGWEREGGGHTNSHPKAYHSNRDCPYLKQAQSKIMDTTVESAERMGLTHCTLCSGDREPGQLSARPCPLCGEEVYRLPSHLPHCPEG